MITIRSLFQKARMTLVRRGIISPPDLLRNPLHSIVNDLQIKCVYGKPKTSLDAILAFRMIATMAIEQHADRLNDILSLDKKSPPGTILDYVNSRIATAELATKKDPRANYRAHATAWGIIGEVLRGEGAKTADEILGATRQARPRETAAMKVKQVNSITRLLPINIARNLQP